MMEGDTRCFQRSSHDENVPFYSEGKHGVCGKVVRGHSHAALSTLLCFKRCLCIGVLLPRVLHEALTLQLLLLLSSELERCGQSATSLYLCHVAAPSTVATW